MIAPRHGRLWAILRQRCPQCREGRVFPPRGRMHPRCPVCDLQFEREAGYFLGAMYFSYGLSCLFLILGAGLAYLLFPDWQLEWTMLVVIALYLPFVPMMFRYSRVLWIHLDRWAWKNEV